jgi:hypothetical protein
MARCLGCGGRVRNGAHVDASQAAACADMLGDFPPVFVRNIWVTRLDWWVHRLVGSMMKGTK